MAAYHERHAMERMRGQLVRADRELRTAEHFLDPGSAEGAEMDLIRAAAPVYHEDVNDRGVVGWIRLAEEDERGREDRT